MTQFAHARCDRSRTPTRPSGGNNATTIGPTVDRLRHSRIRPPILRRRLARSVCRQCMRYIVQADFDPLRQARRISLRSSSAVELPGTSGVCCLVVGCERC
jgi:hypothetical protein